MKWFKLLILFLCIYLCNCRECLEEIKHDDHCVYCEYSNKYICKPKYQYKNQTLSTITETQKYIFILKSITLEIQCKSTKNWYNFNVNDTDDSRNIKHVLFDDCQLPNNQQLILLFKQFNVNNVARLDILSQPKQMTHSNLTRHHLKGFQSVNNLVISNNFINNSMNDLLHDLTKLKRLKIINNELKEIPDNFFDKQIKLEILQIEKNDIKIIKKNLFNKLESLSDLQLIENNIMTIEDKSFDNLVLLKSINLKSNMIKILSDNIFLHQRNIETITLTLNEFSNKSLSSKLLINKNKLVTFHLNENRKNLTTLPNKFLANLHELKVVYINDNNLIYLPEDLFLNSTNIKHIFLQQNNLNVLPIGIFLNLKSLEKIDLSKNQIEIIPRNLFDDLSSLEELNLQGNKIYKIEMKAFIGPKNLQTVNLAFNNLTLSSSSNKTPFEDLINIRNLDLSNNKISQLIQDLKELKKLLTLNLAFNEFKILNMHEFIFTSELIYIDMSDNKIKNISFDHIDEIYWPDIIKRIIQIKLSGNPLNCNCNINTLLLYLKEKLKQKDKNSIILNVNNLICDEPKELQGSFVEGLDSSYINCPIVDNNIVNTPVNNAANSSVNNPSNKPNYNADKSVNNTSNNIANNNDDKNSDTSSNKWLIGSCIFLSVISILCCVVIVIYHFYHHEIKIWLYDKKLCLWWVTEYEVEKSKNYDAFISYSDKDRDFVINNLINKLENGGQYKLCVHYRDWPAGEWIPDQVIRSVINSKRTVVILSKNFLSSEWAKLEFRTAYCHAMKNNKKKVIIVIYGDVPSADLLDDELREYLYMNTYVKWGDPWFWQKLKYALPHCR
ncbi:hypothetical protein HCN44_008196 [Aphidius gifuensis]|uniref:TIR domain-containing protein n=1 Tax=Aphidius gifuensis TaxID=684658 RepID=A0A835CMQ5_APHGI|nr:hypothetical protein HCN44_008196 [Aphidius gifuensis]